MVKIGTLTLYSNKGGNSFSSVTNHYIGRASSIYKIYYKIPITISNEKVTSLTLTTGIWVTDRGDAQTNTINARLYTDEAKARKYGDGHIASATTGSMKIYATSGPISFKFDDLDLKSSTTLYVSMVTVSSSPNLLEIVKYYYPGASTSNTKKDAGATVTSQVNSYTVKYEANGGTSTPSSQTKYHDETLKLAYAITKVDEKTNATTTFAANGGTVSPSSRESRVTTSYSFDGWESTDGTKYAGGASYTKNESTTMTATWKGEVTGSYVSLPTPTKDGHTFDGWYDSTGTTKYTSYAPTSSTTLYAKWSVNSYTVTFNPNHGAINEGCEAAKEVKYGDLYGELPPVTRRGHTHAGWMHDNFTISKDTPMTFHYDHTLIAVWDTNIYTVVLHSGDGKFYDETYEKSYDIPYSGESEYKDNVHAPVRVGYNFVGWTTNENGTDDTYDWQTKLKSKWRYIDNEYGITSGEVNLYPMWTQSALVINYNIYKNTQYHKSLTVDTPITNVDEMPSVKDVFYGHVLPHHKAFGWYTENGDKITNFITLLSNIDGVSKDGYGLCNVYAKVGSRYKLLYIDTNGNIHRLLPQVGNKIMCPYIIREEEN